MNRAKLISGIVLAVVIFSAFLINPIVYPQESVTNVHNLDKLGILVYIPADYNFDSSVKQSDFQYYCERNASLFDAVIVMLKLTDKYEEATSYKGNKPAGYRDIISIEQIISTTEYLKDNPDLGFSDSFKGNFTPSPNLESSYFAPSTSVLTTKDLYKALLIALGYKEGVDFNSTNVLEFAASSKVGFKNVENLPNINYYRFSDIVFEALQLKKKDGEVLSHYLSKRNPDFNDNAIELGLISFFPSILPTFKAGSIVPNSFKSQTLTTPDGKSSYREWEARYSNVSLNEMEDYNNQLTKQGWKIESIYDKKVNNQTERFYVYSITSNNNDYFAVLSLNLSTNEAYFWLAS